MTEQPDYKFTVHCNTDKSKRRHFVSQAEAVAYANDLLRSNHKVRIFPYRPPRRYIDILAERGPNG